MDYITSLFAIICSGLNSESSNEFSVKDAKIIVKLADKTKAVISLKL